MICHNGLSRRAYPIISYKGKDVSYDLIPYLTSLSITENLKDKLDSIDISLRNDENRFLKPGYPLEEKEQIQVNICTENWNFMGEEKKKTPTYIFYIDDSDVNSNSAGASGISGPIGSLVDEKNRKHWSNISFKKLATEIANKFGLTLEYYAEDLYFQNVEQENESDLEFLAKLAAEEGIALKISFDKIILFDEEKLEKEEIKRTFDLEGNEIIKDSWSFKKMTREIYDGCQVEYTDIFDGSTTKVAFDREGKEISLEEKEERKNLKILKLRKNSQSKNIKKYAQKMLKRANQKELIASFSIKGDTSILTGIPFNMVNAGIYNGKYMLSQVVTSVKPFIQKIQAYKIPD